MQNNAFLALRIVSFVVFVASLYAGYYLARHHERLFGVDPEQPHEGPSSRAYSQVQVVSLWVHVLLASGAFALLLH